MARPRHKPARKPSTATASPGLMPQWLLRVCSALILLPLTLYLIWQQPALFSVFVWLWVAIGWLEWLNMMNRRQPIAPELRWISIMLLIGVAVFNTMATLTSSIGIIAFGAIMLAVLATRYRASLYWLSGGFIYLSLGGVAMLALRHNFTIGAALVTFLFSMVWATDIGSYLFGRIIGGAKLMPAISPSKTWAGFFGGLFLALLVALLIGGYLEQDTALPQLYWRLANFGALAVALALIAQLGDWFESWVKRQHNVKDAGFLIPGHGGILDRIDSLIITAPFYLIAIFITNRALPF